MTFADVPAGAAIFLDANTLVYYFGWDPILRPVCWQLLERVEDGDLQGYTSADTLSDVAHRLMTLEAMRRFGWPAQGIANRLRRHPAEVQQLSEYRHAIEETKLLGIQVLNVTRDLVSKAADVTGQFGLLASDALIVTVMHDAGLTHLASNDADFDRVPGITRYAPA